jgi:hypothetical protein
MCAAVLLVTTFVAAEQYDGYFQVNDTQPGGGEDIFRFTVLDASVQLSAQVLLDICDDLRG